MKKKLLRTIEFSFINMKRTTYFFTVCLTLWGCSEQNKKQKEASTYQLVVDNPGMYNEVLSSKDEDEINPYTTSNKVYKADNVYNFSYVHFTKDGDKRYFSNADYGDSLAYKLSDTFTINTVKEIQLTVLKDFGMMQHLPDYNQSVIEYKLINHKYK